MILRLPDVIETDHTDHRIVRLDPLGRGIRVEKAGCVMSPVRSLAVVEDDRGEPVEGARGVVVAVREPPIGQTERGVETDVLLEFSQASEAGILEKAQMENEHGGNFFEAEMAQRGHGHAGGVLVAMDRFHVHETLDGAKHISHRAILEQKKKKLK